MSVNNGITETQMDRICNYQAWLLFAIALITYLFTVEPTASFWDCSEYIAVGSKLEIGHPPGNPTWMLVARIASLFAYEPGQVALAINVTSGIFTAFAVYFLALLIFRFAKVSLQCFSEDESRCPMWKNVVVLASGSVGALTFAWCDSAWFSAVEAEVYAFSIFCTAAILHFMFCWSDRFGKPDAGRYLVLVAYLTGLSIGVHQLTLLCIPALALVYLFHRRENIRKRRLVVTLVLSMALIALILYGLMPGMVAVAQQFELMAVNICGFDYNSGLLIYAGLLIIVAVTAIVLVYTGFSRRIGSFATAVFIWLTGMFGASEQLLLSTIISLVCGVGIFYLWRRKREALYISLWGLVAIVTGYSTYTLILVRGASEPPMDQTSPGNIFSFASYLGRDQYGKKPLIYGRTLFSRPLRKEQSEGGEHFSYVEPARMKRGPVYFPYITGAEGVDRSGFLSFKDSIRNSAVAKRGKGYYKSDYSYSYFYPPELDMWFPRMLSPDPGDIQAYESWSGMTRDNMVSIEASEALDSAGNPVGKYDVNQGKRVKISRLRPSYVQNLSYLGSYQIGYMYLRYLMWNFSGRQNDLHSTGEGEHGNFITGIDLIDNAMLGDQDLIPPAEGKENPGHNVYYMIPFIVGIIGAVWQFRGNRYSIRNGLVTLMLFVMTGIAIVIYLNQDPGEPRERDYSFVGSFYAFAVWVGLGAGYLCKCAAKIKKRNKTIPVVCTGIVTLCVPFLIFVENIDDHDRSGRYAVSDFAKIILMPLEKDAVLFVKGDNYTFPLWYAQEVEGIRRDVRVVSIPYLTTNWYLPQLLRPAYESSPVTVQAPLEKIGYGRFALVMLSSCPYLTPVDGRDALSKLYKSKDRIPELKEMVWRIPSPDRGDSILIDVRSHLHAGRRFITQNQLFMLDMIVSEAYRDKPRPLYWISALKHEDMLWFTDRINMVGPVSRFYYGEIPSEKERALKVYGDFMKVSRWGGLDKKGVYADETVRKYARMFRKHILFTGKELARNGEKEKGLEMARLSERVFPADKVPYITAYHHFITYQEALELAELYLEAGERDHALSIIDDELNRVAGWRKFYNSLSPGRRDVMSLQVELESSELYAAVRMWERAGGPKHRIDSLIQDLNLDIDNERRKWSKKNALRRMVSARRYPSDSSKEVELKYFKQFIENGGSLEELSLYPEYKKR